MYREINDLLIRLSQLKQAMTAHTAASHDLSYYDIGFRALVKEMAQIQATLAKLAVRRDG